METPRRRFHDAIGTAISQFRHNRTGNYHQRKHRGLITDWYRSRVLAIQTSYMMITRAQIHVLNLQDIAQRGELTVQHDDTFIRVVNEWKERLTDRTLFEAYQASRDPLLLFSLIGLLVEERDMAEEIARRLGGKRFTVEMIRSRWGEEDRTDSLSRLIDISKAKRFAGDLVARALKDRAVLREDLSQSNWQRVLELWDERPRRHEKAPKRLTWFPAIPMLPHEQTFFEGPIARAWEKGLPKVLAEFLQRLEGETERILWRLRYAREAQVEKIERHLPHMVPEIISFPGETDDDGELSRIDMQAFREWQRGNALAALIEKLVHDLGGQATRYVALILSGHSESEAARGSKIDPSTKAALRNEFRRIFRPTE